MQVTDDSVCMWIIKVKDNEGGETVYEVETKEEAITIANRALSGPDGTAVDITLHEKQDGDKEA